MGRLTENSVVNIKNKSHAITAANHEACLASWQSIDPLFDARMVDGCPGRVAEVVYGWEEHPPGSD